MSFKMGKANFDFEGVIANEKVPQIRWTKGDNKIQVVNYVVFVNTPGQMNQDGSLKVRSLKIYLSIWGEAAENAVKELSKGSVIRVSKAEIWPSLREGKPETGDSVFGDSNSKAKAEAQLNAKCFDYELV